MARLGKEQEAIRARKETSTKCALDGLTDRGLSPDSDLEALKAEYTTVKTAIPAELAEVAEAGVNVNSALAALAKAQDSLRYREDCLWTCEAERETLCDWLASKGYLTPERANVQLAKQCANTLAAMDLAGMGEDAKLAVVAALGLTMDVVRAYIKAPRASEGKAVTKAIEAGKA